MAVYWPTVTAALDTSTAVCAGFNSLYFLDRLTAGEERDSSRRVAIGVLALASLALMVEALALLALRASGSWLLPGDSPAWVVVRLLPALASLAMALLVARRVSER